MFVPLNDIVIVAQRYGVPTSLALSLVPILNGARYGRTRLITVFPLSSPILISGTTSFFGRTIPNLIADKVGRFNIMILTSILSAILCLALWLPGRGIGPSIAFAILFGFSTGAVIGLGPVLLVMISPMSEMGTRMGTYVAFAAVGTLTSPPIGNTIAAATPGGTYVYTALFAGVNFLIAAVGLWVLRTRLGGWGLRSRV